MATLPKSLSTPKKPAPRPVLWWHPWIIGLSCLLAGLLVAGPARAQATRRPPVRENNKSPLSNQAPVKEKEVTPLSPKKLEEALRLLLNATGKDSAQAPQPSFRPTEIDGLVIDQTVSKVGHDFYDVFLANWEPPEGLSDFTVVLREKPGRSNSILVSVEVNENELLELPLQPKYEAIEEAAFYSLAVATEFLINSRNVSNQLEKTADDPGTEVF